MAKIKNEFHGLQKSTETNFRYVYFSRFG